MNLLQSLLYGIVSGFTEFLPISSQGHQIFLKKVFGVSVSEPLRDLLIHIALLLAIIICSGTYLVKIRREMKTFRSNNGRRVDKRVVYDFRLIRTAIYPMIAVLLLCNLIIDLSNSMAMLALLWAINGVVLYIPEHLPNGNKDSGKMSTFDGILLGLVCGISVIPGLSRIGTAISLTTARGAAKTKAYNWILIISIPVLIFLMIIDFIALISGGFGAINFMSILGYLISSVSAFAAAVAGIYLMRFLTVRASLSPFGFYCWGAALLSFILYLMT